MPMGVVTDEDFKSELNKVNAPVKKESIPVIEGEVIDGPNKSRGRTSGAVEVPEALRRIIGEESTTNGRQAAVELASKFGLSPSSVSAYAVGATSTATYDERPNVDIIKDARGRIKTKASRKLMLALNNMTPEAMSTVKPRDLAGIAKDMSSVIRNMEEGDSSNGKENGPTKPTFLVYAPTVKEENHYQTVIAKE